MNWVSPLPYLVMNERHKSLVFLVISVLPLSILAEQGPDVITQERKLEDLEILRKLNYTNDALTMGPDLVFIDRGEMFVNPSQATILKPIKFNSLKSEGSEIRRISRIHKACCRNITALYATPDEQYIIPPDVNPTFFQTATNVCEKLGLHLPEIRSPVDKWKLAEFMRKNDIDSVHAGVKFHIFSRADKTDTFMYQSTDEPLDPQALALNQICQNVTYNGVNYQYKTRWPGMFFDSYYSKYTPIADLPLEYVYEHGNVVLCPNVGVEKPISTGKPLRVVCQQERVSNQDQKVKDLEALCYQRQEVIDNTVESLVSSINTIEYAFNSTEYRKYGFTIPRGKFDLNVPESKAERKEQEMPEVIFKNTRASDITDSDMHRAILEHFDNNNHITKPLETNRQVINQRSKRSVAAIITMGSSIIAGISALVSVLIHLYEASTPTVPDYHPAVEALTLNSQYVVNELHSLENSLSEYITGEEQYLQYEHIESLIYTSFARMESNIQDNLLDMVNTLSNAANNLVTLRMINHSDLDRLDKIVKKDSTDHLSQDISTYRVDPVFANNTLYLAITVPIVSESRRARIYSIDQIPSFLDGVKYLPDCGDKHIVIYEHAAAWSHITELEAMKCLTKKQPCFISGTKNQFSTTSCSAAQYFLKEHNIQLKKTTDTLPFLLSHNDTIIYSTDDSKHLRLQFHCSDVKSAGADRDHLINGKGMMYNKEMCKFEIPTVGISYEPATTFESMFRGKSVGTIFKPVPGPTIPFPFPTRRNTTFGGKDLEKVRKVPETPRASSSWGWLNTTSLLSAITILLTAILICSFSKKCNWRSMLPPWLSWLCSFVQCPQQNQQSPRSNDTWVPLMRPPFYDSRFFEQSTSTPPSHIASPYVADPRVFNGIRQIPDSDTSGSEPPIYVARDSPMNSTTLSGHDTSYTRASNTIDSEAQHVHGTAKNSHSVPVNVSYSIQASPEIIDSFERTPTSVTKLDSNFKRRGIIKREPEKKDTVTFVEPKYVKTEIIHKVDENVMNKPSDSASGKIQLSNGMSKDLKAASQAIAQSTKRVIDQTNQALKDSKM